MSPALRRRPTRLEKVDGEPMFGDQEPEQLRQLAGLLAGAVVGRDLAAVPAAALPRAPDRAIEGSSDVDLARMIELVEAALAPASAGRPRPRPAGHHRR